MVPPRSVKPVRTAALVRVQLGPPRGITSHIVMSSSENETLRVLSSLPKGSKMNTIRCEYRRGILSFPKSSQGRTWKLLLWLKVSGGI